jgi:hypothetical protein
MHMTVVSFRDGSLVVPARFTTSDGSVEDGVKRIDRRHPSQRRGGAAPRTLSRDGSVFRPQL